MDMQSQAIEILKKSNDGNDLTGDQLLLVEYVVNNLLLTEYGLSQWKLLTDLYL